MLHPIINIMKTFYKYTGRDILRRTPTSLKLRLIPWQKREVYYPIPHIVPLPKKTIYKRIKLWMGSHPRGGETSISQKRTVEQKRKITTQKYTGNHSRNKKLYSASIQQTQPSKYFRNPNPQEPAFKGKGPPKPGQAQNCNKNTEVHTTKRHKKFLHKFPGKETYRQICFTRGKNIFPSKTELSQESFNILHKDLPYQLTTDLFANRSIQKLPQFISYPLPSRSTRCLSPEFGTIWRTQICSHLISQQQNQTQTKVLPS